MKLFASCIAAFLVLAVSPVGEIAAAQAIGEGKHPWDLPSRTRKRRTRSSTWGYRSVENFYYSRWRTETHALHPYYRGKYPNLGYDGDNAFRRYWFGQCNCDGPGQPAYDAFRVRTPQPRISGLNRYRDDRNVFERSYDY